MDLRRCCQCTESVCITSDQGAKLKSKIKAKGFIECSAKHYHNVNWVFDQAILSVRQRFSNK